MTALADQPTTTRYEIVFRRRGTDHAWLTVADAPTFDDRRAGAQAEAEMWAYDHPLDYQGFETAVAKVSTEVILLDWDGLG